MKVFQVLARGLLVATMAALFSFPASAQTLPEVPLHFHGNTHEGSPLPCTGNGATDVSLCGGPFLKESDVLDTAPAAHFDFAATGGTAARSIHDGNWTWKPTAPTTVQGAVVVNFWASCNATCIAFGGEWAVSVWKNNVQVAPAPTADPDDTDPTFLITATPAAPDVAELLSGYFRIATPIALNGTTDTLTIKLENNYIDAGQGSRIYYDSTNACPGALPGEACDSTALFNAADFDADGVPDALDECLGTPAGVPVQPNGCPAEASCVAGAAAASSAALPAAGPTSVDLPVQLEWARLAPTAKYGAIVHFYRQGTRSQQDALLRRMGLTKINDFRRYTSAVYVEGPVNAFQELIASPWIKRIEHNAPLRLLDATQSWATRIRMVQERVAEGPYKDAHGDILAGKGVTLGIIDGGLFGAHPDFAGRITHNFKIVNPFLTGVPQYVDVGEADSENVAGGHGTHVTGIVAGGGTQSDGGYPNADVAPWAPGTFTSASPQANIIHWAHGAGILIISANVAYQHMLDNLGDPTFATLRAVNNSYGETTPGTAYNPDDAGKQMIKQIVGCGVNMVFAAGNDGGDGSADMTSSYCKDPTPGVICVASYNDQGTGALDAPLSSFSSRGHQGTPSEYPDIAAPGDLSTSTCAQATATQAICTGGDDQAAETEWQPWYGTISGTSMATPNVVGVIGALAQAKPSLTPAEIEKILQRTARKIGGGYEADPQFEGSTIHYGYGAGLVDMQAALNELAADPANGIVKSPLLATDEEWTVFDADVDNDVAEFAADAVKLTMQNYNLNGPGVMYRVTVFDATDFISPALSFRLEQNVRGVPARTTIIATPDGVSAAEAGPNNTAVATQVERAGNVISFFVPYSQLGYPPINEPIHNIRVVVSNDAGALDYAPSPAASTVATAAVQPMFGRAFTTRLAPGSVPPSNERACELPGVTRVISGAGTSGDSSQTGMDDLRRIWVAEPADMPGKLVITMKVDNLNPAPIANYRWYVYFKTPARSDVEAEFVAMDTVAPGSSAAPRFIRGYRETISTPAADVGSFTVEGDLPGSSFNTDGTITLVLDKAQFGLTTGMAVGGLAGSIRQTSNPQNGTGLTVDSASALDPYVLLGNLPCSAASLPVASLVSDVVSGIVPLAVEFDASGSTPGDDADIVSYTFNFGDGSAAVTQDEPTIEHTYTVPGSYTASLSVTDSAEASSANVAEIDIEAIANNLPPIADAGDDVVGDIGETLVLDGSGSVDPEHHALTYTWSQLSGPSVSLQPGANSTQRTFVAPSTTAPLTFRLTVSDGVSSDTDDVFVTVRPGAAPPVPPKGIGNNQAGGMGPSGLLLLGLLGLARRRRRAGATYQSMEMSMRTSTKTALFLLATLATGTAAAQDLGPDRYIGYGFSYLSPGDREVDYGTGFELSYAQSWSPRNWLEAKVFLGVLETGTPTIPDFYQTGIGADYLRSLGNEGTGHWFALGGGGLVANDATPDENDGSSYYLNAGLGYRGRLWSRWGVRPRVELRYVHDTFAQGTNDIVLGFKLEMPPNRQMTVEKIVELQATCVVPPVAEAAPAAVVSADTDGDGVADGVDACPGTLNGARVDATGCVKEEQKINLPNIEFEPGKTVLVAGGKQKLEAVVDFLNNQREVEVDVFGHTDAQGKDSYNQNLSEGRAKAVMDYLVSRGIPGTRMTSKGFGETQPISSNDTVEGRAQNRRVELLLRTKSTAAL